MGNEIPGADHANVIFTILEIQRRMHRREEYISIPLLGGEKIILSIVDVMHPGYQKIVPGQGMPKSHEQREERKLYNNNTS